MSTKRNALRMVLAGAVIGAFLIPTLARAIEVKKQMNYGGGNTGGAAESSAPSAATPKNPLTPALANRLNQIVSDQSEQYVDEESEKKSNGEGYVDLEHAKFKYLPTVSGGKTEVKAELEAAEYAKKGKPTGKNKKLVFDYKLEGNQWKQVADPKWEDAGGKGGGTASK